MWMCNERGCIDATHYDPGTKINFCAWKVDSTNRKDGKMFFKEYAFRVRHEAVWNEPTVEFTKISNKYTNGSVINNIKYSYKGIR